MLKKRLFLSWLIVALLGLAQTQVLFAKTNDKSTDFFNTKFQNDFEKIFPEPAESNNLTSGTGKLLQNFLMDRFVFNFDNGAFILEQARAMDISNVRSNVEVTMKVKSAGGKEIGSFSSFAQPPGRNKSWWMSQFSPKQGTPPVLKILETGDYFLEFSAEGKVFDSFPFSISTMAGRNGATWYLVNGLWNDHAIIDTEVEFKFSLWMRDMLVEAGTRNQAFGKYSAQIIREKDKKVIGLTNHSESSTIAPLRKWTRYNITFVKDKTMGGKVEVADVTAQDGNYHIEFNHDGKLYGKYPFSVKGGKLQSLTEFKQTSLQTSEGIITWLKRN